MKKKLIATIAVVIGAVLLAEPGLAKRKKQPTVVGADYKSYTAVLSTPTKSESHENRLITIYANSVGLESYKAMKSTFPEGTILAKEGYAVKDGKAGALVEVTVMKKLKAGTNKATKDWYFATLNPDLSLKEENGKKCIECHAFSPTDNVFGAPK